MRSMRSQLTSLADAGANFEPFGCAAISLREPRTH